MGLPLSPCTVAQKVALRRACLGCDGRPDHGQRTFTRGETCVLQGDPATHLYAVVAGYLRESTYDGDGRALAARIVGPGHVLGMSALSARPSETTATVEALTPARICILPAAEARAWLTQHPEHAVDLAAVAAEDVDELRRGLARRARPADERVLDLLLELARAQPDPTAWFRLPATREQLGEVLGLALETVSRAMKRLKDQGLIGVRAREVRILKVDPA